MAEHVDHVELIFGIDAELNSDSNGEDLQKIAAGLGVLWFITSLSQEHLLKTAPVRESKILKSWSLNLSPVERLNSVNPTEEGFLCLCL